MLNAELEGNSRRRESMSLTSLRKGNARLPNGRWRRVPVGYGLARENAHVQRRRVDEADAALLRQRVSTLSISVISGLKWQ